MRLAGALVALLLGLFCGSASATAPGVNGPIVFSSYGKIYTVQPDGSGLHPVIRADEDGKYDYFPSWSPDGLRIVTSGEMREPDNYWTTIGLQVFSPDGSGFERLPIFGYIESPAWSPDGSRIAFIRERELLTTTPEGAPPTHVENNAWSPAWSPDGGKIAFVRPNGPDEDTDLYTVSSGGGSAQLLLATPGMFSSPTWSPDGSTIVFAFWERKVRENPGPGELPYFYVGPNLYAVPASGGLPVQLTAAGTDRDPEWSPDGSTIVFQSERPPASAPSLYLMNADGSDERQLTSAIDCLQCGPSWASLPPHTPPSGTETGRSAEPMQQKFTHLGIGRRRVGRSTRLWVRFRAELTERVAIVIRRPAPPLRPFRCGVRPSLCPLAGRGERRARSGANRISLNGLLDGAPKPGRYWLQLRSSSGEAEDGLAFRVPRPRRQSAR